MTSYLRSWLTPSIPTVSVDDGDETETERHDNDDSPPAFPSLSSAQRVQSSKAVAESKLMPPPTVIPIRSGSNTLAVPPTTTKAPTKTKKREKVALAPGHSPLDWAKLKSSGQDLRASPCVLS